MKIRNLLIGTVLMTAALSLAVAQDNAEPAQPDGAEQYQLFCAACHMSDGSGAEGAGRYPNLANNIAVEVSADLVISRILHGYGAMPSFSSRSNEEIAAIVNFVRGTFNNSEQVIDADYVEAMRGN